MTPLNGPLEAGLRVLILLVESDPQMLDLNQLVLLDHCVVHSADFGGPSSLHPPLPIRSGELSVKRQVLSSGLRAMLQMGLAELHAKPGGFEFACADRAESFVGMLEAEYARALRDRARWVVQTFGALNDDAVRNQIRSISSRWDEEFFDSNGAA